MPIPTFTALRPKPQFEDIVQKLNELADELTNLMLNLDDANFDKITAVVMDVQELSAITANMGTITAGTITGALIQNQVAEGNRVYMDAEGFHAKDESGVERITISSTPDKGAKAIITRDELGVEHGVYTYDTENVDGADRTGQYIAADGSYILLGDDGRTRIQDVNGRGFRTQSSGYPEMNDGFGWVDIAKAFTGFTGSFSTGTQTVTVSNGIITSVV